MGTESPMIRGTLLVGKDMKDIKHYLSRHVGYIFVGRFVFSWSSSDAGRSTVADEWVVINRKRQTTLIKTSVLEHDVNYVEPPYFGYS